MSALDVFLNPTSDLEELEIEMPRFRSEDGKPAVIKMRALSAQKNDDILKVCKKRDTVNGIVSEVVDSQKYMDNLILEMIVEPNFRDEKFVKAMGKVNPVEAIKSRFTAREYNQIIDGVNKLLGITDINNDAKN